MEADLLVHYHEFHWGCLSLEEEFSVGPIGQDVFEAAWLQGCVGPDPASQGHHIIRGQLMFRCHETNLSREGQLQ